MNPSDWPRIQALFTEVVAHPAADRARILEQLTPGEEALRAEVSSLLACDRPEQPLHQVVRTAAAATFQTEAGEGERLGSYRLIRKLGQGGMGTVYLAVRADDQYQHQVAIKLVSLGLENPQSVERFRRERQILASLDHPYIARLMDGGSGRLAGFPHETPYFVMEYVEGEPVTEYCLRNQVDLAARLQLFLKICEAVTYAHQKLVVHRDLKPGNILVTAAGVPKLLDFGIAKLLEGNEPSALTTIAGLGMTPDFASPEQVLEGQITAASDVYSLGAILYLLLTGAKPHRFVTSTSQEVQQVVCKRDPPTLSQAAPHLARQLQGDLEAIVAKAMRKEPERRYPSVEQFSGDLQRYLNGWPVAARHGNLRYKAGKYLRRNRTAIAAGIVIAGALAAGTTVATIEALRASRSQLNAEREREHAVSSQREALLQAQEALRQSAYAETQRREAVAQKSSAQTQRALADRRFEQVHQLAGKFLLDFHAAIEKLPGATPARKMVVQTGLQYYDMLVKEAGNNRPLLEEIASGYDRLGDVQGNPYYANLGDARGAAASYRKAQSIRDKISDPSPAFWRDRILGSVKLSQVAAAQTDLKAAEQYLQDAFRLARQSPTANSRPVQTALSRAYSSLGDLKIRESHYSEAVDPFVKLLDLETQLSRDASDPREAQSGLSLAHTKLGDLFGRMEREPEALEHLHLALAIDKRLSDAEPNSFPLTRRLYITYTMLGRVLRSRLGQQLGAPGEVQGYLEQAVSLADRMRASDPDNRSALSDVANADTSLGQWFRLQGNPLAALPFFEKAVAAGERANALAGPGAGNEDLLIQVHERLAEGLADATRFDQAFQELATAEKYLAIAEKQNPGLARNAGRLAEILRVRADAFFAQEHWNDAALTYRQLIALFDAQLKLDPHNDVYLNERPRLYAALADCYAALLQWDSASASMQTALTQFHDIETRRPLIQTEADERAAAAAKLAQWTQR